MWFYKEKEVIELPEGFEGFVYIITNKVSGRKYIGRKVFYNINRKLLKGKTRKTKIKTESDWRDYYGSSPEIKKDIELLGKESFHREILHLCKTRGENNYLETKEIIMRDAILDENYYNGWVQCKITSAHVKSLQFKGTI